MTLRLVPYDQLDPALERERLALTIGAFSGVLDRRALEVLRRGDADPTEYVGLFAVERGHLVGETLVLRMAYRGARGALRVAGVSSVTTRVDARRRGVATALLKEVHRRERARGLPYALLWTSQGWLAHRLYEELGYRDVYTPSIAVRLLPDDGSSRTAPTLHPARRSDLPALEALHAEVTKDAYGFVPRAERFLSRRREAGGFPGELWVARRRGRRLGYALVASEQRQLRCGELVARPDDLPDLLDALERRARPGLLAIGETPARALAGELRARGYLVRREAVWRTLMALRLDRRRSAEELRRELAVDRPGFVCMGLDRF